MSMLQDILAGKKESQSQRGTQAQQGTRGPSPFTRPSADVLIRLLMGQFANPPNTAIAGPLGQAVTTLQGLGPSLQQRATGSVFDSLMGTNQGPSMNTGTGPAGTQSRTDLGLPDRSSYFTFKPTADQVANLGILPGLSASKGGKAAVKRAKAGKKTPRRPELEGGK